MGAHQELASSPGAEEIGALTSDMKDRKTCEAFEALAAGYDEFAKVQEKLAKADKAGGKR